MMGKNRKKPVVIKAFQWFGQPKEGWPAWFLDRWPDIRMDEVKGSAVMVIPTLEGDHMASINDWIIQGVKGEIYPCKPDIFEQTYEAV